MGLITHIVKSGVLRQANTNSVLKTYLLKPVETATFVKDESMADERALLRSVRWSKNETLS